MKSNVSSSENRSGKQDRMAALLPGLLSYPSQQNTIPLLGRPSVPCTQDVNIVIHHEGRLADSEVKLKNKTNQW